MIKYESDHQYVKRFFELEVDLVLINPECSCNFFKEKEIKKDMHFEATFPAYCTYIYCNFQFKAYYTYKSKIRALLDFQVEGAIDGDVVIIKDEKHAEKYEGDMLDGFRRFEVVYDSDFAFYRDSFNAYIPTRLIFNYTKLEEGKPKVKRENSFYENFVARAARMKISSSAVQNLVNLPDSLRICQITEQNFAQFRILVNISIEGKHSEEFFDSVKNAPTFSAIAYFDGHPAGFINCYLRNENVCFCVRTMGVKDIDAVRLFQRFGFTRHREGEDESCGGILQLYVRPVKKIKDAWEKLQKPAAKKAKLDLKKPSGDLRRLKALNRQLFADKYDDETHRSILDSPNMSALAFLNDKPVGSMTCEKWDTGDLKLLEVMALGVLSDYKELEDDIKKLLLNHASKMAENSADIHLLTYYVQQDHLATIALLSKFGFTFWLPIPEYYRHNTRNDVYYIKKTSRMFTKKVVATVVDETEEKREGPLDIKFDLKTFDVSKLISINQSLLIADITEDTVESLNQLNTEISPTSNNENLFKNVLATSNMTRLAFFDGIPCGFIHTEKNSMTMAAFTWLS
uniref:N-acetyltransferase domain-containing protein n=1 Tax=Caenorhabditis tropicalis TaxID=1561998 RepID=A0A1I7UIK8_9PELO